MVEGSRHLEEIRGGIVAHLAVGPVGRQCIGDPVSRRKLGDTGPGLLDVAGALEAEHDRQRRHRPGVRYAAAVIGIDEVEPDRLVAQPNLAGAGRRYVDGFPAQHIGRPFLVEHRCHRHRLLSSCVI